MALITRIIFCSPDLCKKHCGMGPSLDCLLLQVPFLSVDGDIGIRTIQHTDTSPFSGEYVIEDVKGSGAFYFRRLIFLSNRNIVQSEARLSSRVSHKGEITAVFTNYGLLSSRMGLRGGLVQVGGMYCTAPLFSPAFCGSI